MQEELHYGAVQKNLTSESHIVLMMERHSCVILVLFFHLLKAKTVILKFIMIKKRMFIISYCIWMRMSLLYLSQMIL